MKPRTSISACQAPGSNARQAAVAAGVVAADAMVPSISALPSGIIHSLTRTAPVGRTKLFAGRHRKLQPAAGVLRTALRPPKPPPMPARPQARAIGVSDRDLRDHPGAADGTRALSSSTRTRWFSE